MEEIRSSRNEAEEQHLLESREREPKELPEGSVTVELDIQTHEKQRSNREDGLPQSQSQARTGPHRPRQFLHNHPRINPSSSSSTSILPIDTAPVRNCCCRSQ